MGVKGWLNKISGGDNKSGNAFFVVFGADRRFFRRYLESQGSHCQDNNNRLAYFSSSDAVGTLRKTVNGATKALHPVSLAFELATELYSFSGGHWIPDRLGGQKQGGTGTNGHHELFERDPVLDNGLAEGFALAHQKRTDEQTRQKLMQILLVAVLAAGTLTFLVAASTGQLGNLFSGFGKVFGGG